MSDTPTDQDRIKALEAENERLQAGIIKAFQDLHAWATSNETGRIYDITRSLKALLKGGGNG